MDIPGNYFIKRFNLPIFHTLLWSCWVFTVGCKPESNLNLEQVVTISARPVKELDAVRSSSGAILLATMERSDSGVPEHICVLYRSEDNGLNWQEVSTLDDTSQYTRQYADPRLVEDPNTGKIYLVLMQVRLPANRNRAKYRRDYYLGDIAVYRSDDDGQSWDYQSSPHIDPVGAYGDLPFPAVDLQGCLWVFHSKLDIRRLIAPSEMIVHRSCDEGKTWNSSYSFADSTIARSRKNLGNLVIKDRNIVAGTFADPESLYYFELEHQQDIRLKRIESIPHDFGEANIPIAYLYSQGQNEQLGIISYLPHQRNSPIWYAGSMNGEGNWTTQKISSRGAYPNVVIDKDGKTLITFNRKQGKNFELMQTLSQNGIQSFTQPVPMYQQAYQRTEYGEYQDLLVDSSGQKHLIFCDWSDDSRAKIGRIVK